MSSQYKRPESVLVVVHAASGEILLLQRTDHPEFWQSVTGSLRWDEDPAEAARRELEEETGLAAGEGWRDWRRTCAFPILPGWRHRYAPEVQYNLEHLYSLRVARPLPVRLNPAEHSAFEWLGVGEAMTRAWSWTNRLGIGAVVGLNPNI